MKKFILLFVGVLTFASCSDDALVVEEALITNEAVQDKGLSAKTGFEVGVCHNGKYKIVQNEDALNDHIAHGDAVDRDGDGFYHIDNPCSETDCDDSSYSEDNSCEIPATIGDLRDGGVVFWVDPADNAHGLVCAIEEQSASIEWYNGSYTVTGAIGTAIGTGTSNTNAIIAAQGATEKDYAAGLARAYRGGGFTDWFLPSKDELNAMYLNQAAINATASANGGVDFYSYYWSSTEDHDSSAWGAWGQHFTSGNQNYYSKVNTFSVRAVRAF